MRTGGNIDLKVKIRLQPKQQQLLNLLQTTGRDCPTVIGFGGARGGAKSGGFRRVILAEQLRLRAVNACIIRRVFPDVRENHIERMRQEYPELEPFYGNTVHEYALPNGSKIGFWYAETPAEVKRKFWGPEFRLALIDQAEQFTEQELVQIRTAVRWPSLPRGSAKLVLGFNPGGAGTEYLRRIFHLKQYKKGEFAHEYAFIQAYGWDNYVWFDGCGLTEEQFYNASIIPGECDSFPDEEPSGKNCCRYHMFIHETQYGREMNSLPPSLRAGHLLGSFDSFAGQYFAGVWDESKTVLDAVETERIVQPWWKRWISIDWGFAHHSSIGWYATGKLSPREMAQHFDVDVSWPVDVVVKFREMVINQTGERELAQMIVDRTPESERTHTRNVYLSPDAFDKRGSANTGADTMGAVFAAGKLPLPERADDSRVNGWRFMWGCLKQTCSTLQSDPSPTGTHPMFLVSAECPETISAIPLATRNDRMPGKIEDVLKTETISDDVLDETRYALKSKLSPRTEAPAGVRFAQSMDGLIHPNQVAMAARIFMDNERRKNAANVRPIWRS